MVRSQKMKKLILTVLVGVLVFSVSVSPVLAQENGEELNGEENGEDLNGEENGEEVEEESEDEEDGEEEETDSEELLEQLREQIELLRTQIEQVVNRIQNMLQLRTQLRDQGVDTEEETKEIQQILKLTQQLWQGRRGEEVELLQEFLATDPEVYPEGLVTGYYGPLTMRAVQRFQERAGIEQVGRVGPQTLSKINELLEEGAGDSGKVPPGLLVSPGIRRLLGENSVIPEGQELPPGIERRLGQSEEDVESDEEEEDEEEEAEEEDTVAPTISVIVVSETESNSAVISWSTDEAADSRVYYDTGSSVDADTAQTEYSSELVEEHEVELAELDSETEYFFFVVSVDEAGNEAESGTQSFTTLELTEE